MNETGVQGNYIYSSLWNDSDLQDLIALFVDELPKRAGTILVHFTEHDWESLRRTAHQLKGAAGSYGFSAISPCAGRIEAAVRNNESEESIRKSVEELSALCACARRGTPATV